EDEEYYDLKQYSRTIDQEYSAPTIQSSLHFSDELKRRDKEWANVAAMAANITRPVDATAYALVKSANLDEPAVKNVLRTLDIVRHHLAVLATTVNRNRQNAMLREKIKVTALVIRLKETSQCIHKDKYVNIKAHSKAAELCPVETFWEYKRRLVGRRITHPHDTSPDLKYNPLIRPINDPDKPVGADKIRNHIKAVMSKLRHPPGAKVPKARAAGATQAALRGTKLDDI
ncbi:hypothetical protein BGW38_009517, partial [Lunasporangiospora selenospora]